MEVGVWVIRHRGPPVGILPYKGHDYSVSSNCVVSGEYLTLEGTFDRTSLFLLRWTVVYRVRRSDIRSVDCVPFGFEWGDSITPGLSYKSDQCFGSKVMYFVHFLLRVEQKRSPWVLFPTDLSVVRPLFTREWSGTPVELVSWYPGSRPKGEHRILCFLFLFPFVTGRDPSYPSLSFVLMNFVFYGFNGMGFLLKCVYKRGRLHSHLSFFLFSE